MRRTTLFLLSAIVLLGTLVFGAARIATAQDTTDYSGHLLVGSWVLDTDLEDDTDLPSLIGLTADGMYVAFEPEGGGTVGAWEPTGDTTAILTFWLVNEDEGSVMFRVAIEVAPDGQTFTASYTIETTDPETGDLSGQIGPGLVEGTRVVAEGPGTPVASFEDFFASFEEGTPEATPES